MSRSSAVLDLPTWSVPFKVEHAQIFTVACIVLGVVILVFVVAFQSSKDSSKPPGALRTFAKFFYATFLKPHAGNGAESGQQAALESFYRAQADVYDATRKRLLRGREDLLGLVAARLKYKEEREQGAQTKPIWVDIGGGTGYNIEAMQAYLDVPNSFRHVYLVDLSPSLCEVARKRFDRLGWKNVTVVCQDARRFRLDNSRSDQDCRRVQRSKEDAYLSRIGSSAGAANLITLSYSLSMIPDFYSVVDSLSTLLHPQGTIGVCDFYVQSIVDCVSRNYTGGVFNRHVNWLGRVFWRAWFDVDRVGLEAARRDYLEYRFGTVLSASDRNYLLGGIPYYLWVGCLKEIAATSTSTDSCTDDVLEQLDASITESPYLSPTHHAYKAYNAVEKALPEVRSKAYESAVINLSGNLPLPSSFYQHHHWRVYYDDQLRKHLQFGNEYIYAFTWEDPRVDHRLLKITENDVILCLTSAGDNVLDYLLGGNPRRVHAVDLNPNQNHLLELKVASLQALSYADFWQLFGVGKHPQFRDLLIRKLSPFLSSRALQYWLVRSDIFTSRRGHGLYNSGGSGNALMLARWLFRSVGLKKEVEKLCNAKTLIEQREIWRSKIRGVLLNRLLNWAVVGTQWFAWKAAGVPPPQHDIIRLDYLQQEGVSQSEVHRSGAGGEAIWEYMVNTLDPVVENTLIGEDNYFYYLCLRGQYSRKCHPAYLTPKAHTKLSRPGAFDGLRIHTDCVNETLNRISPGTLTIAVIMDSMDWFSPGASDADTQVKALNVALKLGGRVLLRSAGLKPWYTTVFEKHGFNARRANVRVPGSCVDRVNMYASTWVCTKAEELNTEKEALESLPELARSDSDLSSTVEQLEI